MNRILLAIALLLTAAGTAGAQDEAIERYLLNSDPELQSKVESGTLTQADINSLTPLNRSNSFVVYVRDTRQRDFRSLVSSLDSERLNKLVGSSGGAGASTSVVSKVAIPAVLGFAIEHGSVLRQTSGTVTTLRANLLGLSNLVTGTDQFCFEVAVDQCTSSSRWLRRVSGSLSFEREQAEDEMAPTAPVPVTDLLGGDDYRMSAWGLRIDLTGSNNLDDPGYLQRWNDNIGKLAVSDDAKALTEAHQEFFNGGGLELYSNWRAASSTELLATTDFEQFKRRLADRLDVLIVLLREEMDFDFDAQVASLTRAYADYFTVRDDLIRELHSHKASIEYLNQRTLNQPTVSTIRFIYSHQPTAAPVLLTLNFGGSFYHEAAANASDVRWKDVQLAGQLDRSLGALGDAGNLVLSLAGYYQWMKDDALISIPAGTLAPGTSIALPGEAATLLNTKGHISVVQGRLTLPVNDTVKIPLSVTWANRTELIQEDDVRGQIGLSLDIDSLFR